MPRIPEKELPAGFRIQQTEVIHPSRLYVFFVLVYIVNRQDVRPSYADETGEPITLECRKASTHDVDDSGKRHFYIREPLDTVDKVGLFEVLIKFPEFGSRAWIG